MERLTVRGVEHVVYTRAEADSLGIAYVPWHEAVVGKWGLTDDGYVTECLYSGQEKRSRAGHTGRYLRFSCARTWTSSRKNTPFLWEERRAGYAQWTLSKNAETWVEREARKSRTKRVARAFATYIAEGVAPDWKKLGEIYRKDQEIPEATVRRLFKQEKIQRMVDKELADILTRQGLTKEYVIGGMKKVVELALAEGDLTNMRLQLKDIGEILEIYPKKVEGFDPSRQIPTAESFPALDFEDEERKMLEAQTSTETK